jgi:glucokinase-like ROK family protein
MKYPLTISGSAMRDINRSAVLELIRRENPISRTAISEKLDISLATVMRIVDELMETDFVRLQGSTEWSGGRRRSLLEFNADGYVVLGIDMGGPKLYGAISDLGGRVLEEVNLGRQESVGDSETFERLVSLIEQLMASPQLKQRRVRGIGVGVPGVTLHKEGVVKWAYAYTWRDFPLKEKLSQRFDLPIIVDNDVNLSALGELWFGAGQNTQNMILITNDIGIGAGIIVDGALYRGANEASGEIGNMIPDTSFLGKDYKNFGALETVASGTALAEIARRSLKDKLPKSELDKLLAEDVFTAARQGKKWAQNIIAKVVDYMAVAIANLSTAFDPEIIILGSGISYSADLFIDPILQRINGSLPITPKLVVSKLGRRATVMGAITNVIHNTSNFYVVHKLS